MAMRFRTPPVPPIALIAVASERDRDGEIYVMDADGGNLTNITNKRGWDTRPA